MQTYMYTVYDSKAKSFSLPFHAVNKDVALRMFGAAVNDPQTQLNQHPEDFVLYQIARYDDETAKIEGQAMEAISTAIALKEVTKNDQN